MILIIILIEWKKKLKISKKIKNIKKAIGAPIGVNPYSAIYVGYPSEEDKSKVKDKYNDKNVKVI